MNKYLAGENGQNSETLVLFRINLFAFGLRFGCIGGAVSVSVLLLYVTWRYGT